MLVYFPFACGIFLLILNKSTNCVVRHDLRFNQATYFSHCTFYAGMFFFYFARFFSPIFVVVLFHFSMCHALRFRSRCINTQFNREFERHLFTYLWFRLKIWKCKFHAYKLEAQSSFFIFRQ